MIAEKEKVSSFGLADLSPLGRKAVYRMSGIDPTVLQCINMSGLYHTIWNAAWMSHCLRSYFQQFPHLAGIAWFTTLPIAAPPKAARLIK